LQTDLFDAPPSGRTGRLDNPKENDDAILVRAQAIMSVEQPGEVTRAAAEKMPRGCPSSCYGIGVEHPLQPPSMLGSAD
jgi:hypothetical protein